MAGAGFRPVTSAGQWDIRASACFRQPNIRNAHPGGDLRDPRCPHELVQILSLEVVGVTSRCELVQGRQIRLHALQWNILTLRSLDLEDPMFLRQLVRVVYFVRNALGRGTQDADPEFGSTSYQTRSLC